MRQGCRALAQPCLSFKFQISNLARVVQAPQLHCPRFASSYEKVEMRRLLAADVALPIRLLLAPMIPELPYQSGAHRRTGDA